MPGKSNPTQLHHLHNTRLIYPPCGEVIIAPSILGGCHSNLASSLDEVHKSGARWLHIDIMDGHFVPNLTFGPQFVKEIRPISKLFFDVHLMLLNPFDFAPKFIDVGADLVTIHAESEIQQIQSTIDFIKSKNKKVGISINPGTPFSQVLPYLKQVDLLLLMTVQPGFGGQSFRSEVLDKIKQAHDFRKQHSLGFRIECDGGVDLTTGKQCMDAGADTLVLGTAFFKAANKATLIESLESKNKLRRFLDAKARIISISPKK